MAGHSRLVASAAAILAVAVLGAATGCSSTSAAGGDSSGGGFVAGDGSIVLLPEGQRVTAPDLVGTTLDGDTFRLADHRGEVVVFNVWASWCAPCRAEAPGLAAVAQEYAGRGVQFAGLDTRDSDTAARAFVDTFDIPYPNVIDRDGQLQLLFSDSLPPQAIPSTVVVDPQGRVAGRVLGRASESTLRGLIDPLLPATSASPRTEG